MAKFLVCQPTFHVDKWEVEAETEKQAKEKVMEGAEGENVCLIDTEYINSDMNVNNWEVTRLE